MLCCFLVGFGFLVGFFGLLVVWVGGFSPDFLSNHFLGPPALVLEVHLGAGS